MKYPCRFPSFESVSVLWRLGWHHPLRVEAPFALRPQGFPSVCPFTKEGKISLDIAPPVNTKKYLLLIYFLCPHRYSKGGSRFRSLGIVKAPSNPRRHLSKLTYFIPNRITRFVRLVYKISIISMSCIDLKPQNENSECFSEGYFDIFFVRNETQNRFSQLSKFFHRRIFGVCLKKWNSNF